MARRRALTTAATARCSRWDSYQRSAAAASSASLGWDAGALASALQPQYDKCAHGNEQSITGSHAPKELPRRWLILSLWPSSWQAMRRRSGLPSLRGSRISGGACVSIVFRAAAAENAQLHHEADKLCHFRLAIANRRKNVAYHILLLHVVVGSWLHINIHGYFDEMPKMATRSNIRGYLPPTKIPLPENLRHLE